MEYLHTVIYPLFNCKSLYLYVHLICHCGWCSSWMTQRCDTLDGEWVTGWVDWWRCWCWSGCKTIAKFYLKSFKYGNYEMCQPWDDDLFAGCSIELCHFSKSNNYSSEWTGGGRSWCWMRGMGGCLAQWVFNCRKSRSTCWLQLLIRLRICRKLENNYNLTPPTKLFCNIAGCVMLDTNFWFPRLRFKEVITIINGLGLFNWENLFDFILFQGGGGGSQQEKERMVINYSHRCRRPFQCDFTSSSAAAASTSLPHWWW